MCFLHDGLGFFFFYWLRMISLKHPAGLFCFMRCVCHVRLWGIWQERAAPFYISIELSITPCITHILRFYSQDLVLRKSYKSLRDVLNLLKKSLPCQDGRLVPPSWQNIPKSKRCHLYASSDPVVNMARQVLDLIGIKKLWSFGFF